MALTTRCPQCHAVFRVVADQLKLRFSAAQPAAVRDVLVQVHRSVVVNSNSIVSATRDENGHYSLAVRGLQRPLKVSRAFGHLFRPM